MSLNSLVDGLNQLDIDNNDYTWIGNKIRDTLYTWILIQARIRDTPLEVFMEVYELFKPFNDLFEKFDGSNYPEAEVDELMCEIYLWGKNRQIEIFSNYFSNKSNI